MNGAAESLVKGCRKALASACMYHTLLYTISEWVTIIAKVNFLVNSHSLFPKTIQNLEELLNGNPLLYQHGQPTVPQNKITFVDSKNPIYQVQKFTKQFLRGMDVQYAISFIVSKQMVSTWK